MPRPDTSCFTVAPGLTHADLAAWVGAEVEAMRRVHRRWFDTYDWALWNAGLVLEVDGGGTDLETTLRDRDTHQPQWHQQVERVPTLATDLPTGPWQRTLGDLLDVRALIPVASCEFDEAELSIVDANRKVVARARWDAAPGQVGSTTRRSVRVVPVRGYEREARRLAGLLRSHASLDPDPVHPLAACTSDGRTPGRSGVELDVRLEPDLEAEEAVRRMLRHLWGTMRLLEPWLTDAPDTEFLHDYRVALRRSRSVLRMSRGVLDETGRDEWRASLGALQRRTGALRDLDVFIIEFPSYREAVPREFATDIEPLLELLQTKRDEEHGELEAYLGTEAHDRLRKDYTEFLVETAGHRRRAEGDDGAVPIGVVAADRIGRAHRRVLKRGRRVEADSPPSRLHDVRIAAKELRYAIELHQSLLPEKQQQQLVTRLKRLQGLLGDFQDAEIHAEAMERFAEELSASGRVPARSIMAIGLLAQHFSERKAALRTGFADRFADFDTPATKKLARSMIDGNAEP